jgi:DNA polymerase-3 subunit alpha
MFDLEDMQGLVRSICWPEEYARLGDFLSQDAVVVVSGTVDRRAGSEETNLIINDIIPISSIWSRPIKCMHLKIAEGRHDSVILDRLKELLARHAGETPVRMIIELLDGSRALLDVDGQKVKWSGELLDEIEGLLGAGAVRVQTSLSGGRQDNRNSKKRRAFQSS